MPRFSSISRALKQLLHYGLATVRTADLGWENFRTIGTPVLCMHLAVVNALFVGMLITSVQLCGCRDQDHVCTSVTRDFLSTPLKALS